MNAVAVRTAPARLLFWPAAGVSLLLTAAGLAPVAAAPLAAVAALAALLAVPVAWPAMTLFVLALLVDNPGERPADGHWESPLFGLGRLLYNNLNSLTGVGALRVSLLEALLGLLGLIVLGRKLLKDGIDDPDHLGALPNPMKHAFATFFGAMVVLELYGIARGGDFKQSLWQLRQLLWLPVLGIVFGHAFKTLGTRLTLLRALMAVAWVRSLMGVYFIFGYARPRGIEADYATTHSDSMLTVVAMIVGVAALAERPTRQHVLLNILLQPVLFLGLIANNRRLAFVGLAAGLAVLIALGPPALWRFVKRSLVVLIPLALLYVAAGWNSNAGVFKPVKMVKSVTAQDDDSSKTRDIENYNLIQTLNRHPLIGSGFGHEYDELVRAHDVTEFFTQYKFIAHNSVLWILAIGGWLGFAALWAIFPTGLLTALRVYRASSNVVDRVTAMAAAVMVALFLLQAWGDMGLQSWMGTLMLAALLGATGALGTRQLQMGANRDVDA